MRQHHPTENQHLIGLLIPYNRTLGDVNVKKLEIRYNPYKMQTFVFLDGIDLCSEKSHSSQILKEFIESKTPLQTWIEPVPYRHWPGIIDGLFNPGCNDEVNIVFSGRKIDFDDLQRSCESQNAKRQERCKIKFHFTRKDTLDDVLLAKNIDEVVEELKSDRFKELVESRSSEMLNEHYADLEKNYNRAKESEFQIVFSGIYSSGKSTAINALIRHQVLPTSSFTCTVKNCRICHDSTLGKNVSLQGYDENDNPITQKEIFNNDAECLKRFKEISPMDNTEIKEEYRSVMTMELCVDLSHLYPAPEYQDKFRIVLIDTPGINSASSIENGKNLHADVALDAITMESKPMIIMCADAETEHDDAIGEFMSKIVEQATEDNGGFNDRFLFLLNCCDKRKYQNDEDANQLKHAYASYLNDFKKWNSKTENAKKASCFIPRIFLTSAFIALAIQKGAYAYSVDQIKTDNEKRNERTAYRDFSELITDYNDENYYLSRYCDIPEYRKKELEDEFNTALENNNNVRATEIQCGFEAVETAIRDYIARYAYPIKVRSLLDTFEAILTDVSECTNTWMRKLKNKEEALGKNQSEREEATGKRATAERKNDSLELAQKRTQNQLKQLDEITFDSEKLKAAIVDFKLDIETNETVKYIKKHDSVNTGRQSRTEVEKEITELLNCLERVFDVAIDKIKEKFNEIADEHEKQIEEVCSVLKRIVNDLKKSDVLQLDGYNFENSILWNLSFKNLNVKNLRSEMDNKINNSYTRTRTVSNSKKDSWRSSRNPFKKFASLFMSSEKTIIETVDGKYSMKPIKDEMANYYTNLEEQRVNMGKIYTSELNGVKQNVRNLIKTLFSELRQCENDISDQNKKLSELSISINKLSKEIEKYKVICDWLDELCEKIKGV